MLVEFQISRNDGGQRAERYLRKRLAAMSLDRLHALFRRKEIKVSRKPIKRNHILVEGDLIQVYGLRPEDTEGNPGTPAADGADESDGMEHPDSGNRSSGKSSANIAANIVANIVAKTARPASRTPLRPKRSLRLPAARMRDANTRL